MLCSTGQAERKAGGKRPPFSLVQLLDHCHHIMALRGLHLPIYFAHLRSMSVPGRPVWQGNWGNRSVCTRTPPWMSMFKAVHGVLLDSTFGRAIWP